MNPTCPFGNICEIFQVYFTTFGHGKGSFQEVPALDPPARQTIEQVVQTAD
jgi:hypothetical protein